MDTNTLGSTPRVWIGCLHCYNSGRLVGEWFDAVDADEATLTDVHRDAGGSRAGCEELWCFDHENLPVRGEMSPSEAAEWGGSLASVQEHHREALCAWVRSGDYVAEGTGDLPSIAKRVLVMGEDMCVSRVYYCPVHGPLSIAVVVDMRAIRARRRGEP